MGYVFVHWATAPTYAPLFSNLAAADASSVIDKLNTAGVPYQIGQNGILTGLIEEDNGALRVNLEKYKLGKAVVRKRGTPFVLLYIVQPSSYVW